MMKPYRFATMIVTATALLSGSAVAGDHHAPADCHISGNVQGAGGYQWLHFKTDSDPWTPRWNGAMGQAAVAGDYSCGLWNVQLDAAGSGIWSNAVGAGQKFNLSGKNLEIGGSTFLRSEQLGTIGVTAATTLVNLSLTRLHDQNSSLQRMGLFGEYYLNEQVTLGGGLSAVGGRDNIALVRRKHSGFEAFVRGNLYLADNWALSVRGDMQRAKLKYQNQTFTWNGFALTGGAEYLLPGMPLSITLNGRLAQRRLGEGNGRFLTIDDKELLLGFRYDFGGRAAGSLLARDRHGPADTVSVMSTKLPNVSYETMNVDLAP